MFNFEEEIKKLPKNPGIYIMKNDKGEIIYVGKAKNLSNRVRSYFRSSTNHSEKVKAMVKNIAEFEYIIVDNEVEALILESNLIKRYVPKYNIVLRDDKSYPYIKVTTNEKYPRILKTRLLRKDGAKYFGQYPNAASVNIGIDIIKRELKLRDCNLNIEKVKGKIRPCLNYFIGKCIAPCRAAVTEEEYAELVDRAMKILQNKDKSLLEKYKSKLDEAVKNLEFEKAAEYLNVVNAFNDIHKEQKITSPDAINRDVLAYAEGISDVILELFIIRDGKILERNYYLFENEKKTEIKDIFKAFISQHYSANIDMPNEIISEIDFPDREEMIEALSKIANHKVDIHVPQRGEKRALVLMAKKNAIDMVEKHADRYIRKKALKDMAMQRFKDLLWLEDVPNRLECYDISNTMGQNSVASMVVYENGDMQRNEYRRFRIKTIVGPDDYGSLREVLERRFMRSMKDKEGSFAALPEVILIDGGLGQASSAQMVLDSLGIEIPVVGLKKDDHHRTDSLAYMGEIIKLDKSSELFKILTRIQDEAHRFAITYHRSLREKNINQSILDEIVGIGPKKKKILYEAFDDIDAIRRASLEKLESVKGISKTNAKDIYEFFRKDT